MLLVDVDDDTRGLYAEAFTAAGWTADGAESGAIALAKALERVPTLVVTELRLPGIDGFELVRILRRDPDTMRVAILVVSTEAAPATIDRATAAGADLVLAKPCAPDVLVQHAAELVTRSQPSRSAPPERVGVTAKVHEPRHAIACPVCGTTLSYTHSHVTRVGRRTEQWLHFTCGRGCGRFEYRERTRKLRQIS